MLPLSLLLLMGCAKARFQAPEYTQPAGLPDAPTPPESIARVIEPSVKMGHETDGVGTVGSLPSDPQIAILPMWDTMAPQVQDGPAPLFMEALGLAETPLPRVSVANQAAPDPVLAATEHRIQMKLLTAGFDRLISPDGLRGISARKEAERDGTITWTAPLSELARIEPVTGADLIMELQRPDREVINLGRETVYEYDAAALDQYEAERERFRATMVPILAQRRTAASTFRAACDDAGRAFTAAGGSYESKRYADAARERGRCDRGEREVRRAVEDAEILAASPRSRETLERMATQQTERESIEAHEVTLRVRLLDGQTLRTLWLGDVTGRADDSSAALSHALDAVVDMLRVQPPPQ